MKKHTYMGHVIVPCERASGEHDGRWTVIAFHSPTGMMLADELCRHYGTLAQARDDIKYWALYPLDNDGE